MEPQFSVEKSVINRNLSVKDCRNNPAAGRLFLFQTDKKFAEVHTTQIDHKKTMRIATTCVAICALGLSQATPLGIGERLNRVPKGLPMSIIGLRRVLVN